MALSDHPINTLSERCIGAAIEVHRALGPGLLESAYRRCLARELELRGLRYREEASVSLEYKGITVAHAYRLDLIVEEALAVEIKSVDNLQHIHSAQLLTYLRLTQLHCGLLINFNVCLLARGIRRILA